MPRIHLDSEKLASVDENGDIVLAAKCRDGLIHRYFLVSYNTLLGASREIGVKAVVSSTLATMTDGALEGAEFPVTVFKSEHRSPAPLGYFLAMLHGRGTLVPQFVDQFESPNMIAEIARLTDQHKVHHAVRP